MYRMIIEKASLLLRAGLHIGLKLLRLCVILWFRVEPPLGVGGWGPDLSNLSDFGGFLSNLSDLGDSLSD